jgi:hypothetical protein
MNGVRTSGPDHAHLSDARAAAGMINASTWTVTAIEGYDPLAHFTENQPVEGKDGSSTHGALRRGHGFAARSWLCS